MLKRIVAFVLTLGLFLGFGVTFGGTAQAKQFCGAQMVGGFALIGMSAKGVSCAEAWGVVKAVERRITSYDNFVYRYKSWMCLTSRDELGVPKVKCSSRFDRVWWGHTP